MALANQPDKAEPQPGTADLASGMSLAAGVPIKNLVDQLRCNALAAVAYLTAYPAVLNEQAHVDAGVGVAVLDGIGQQIDHQPLQQLVVAARSEERRVGKKGRSAWSLKRRAEKV